MARQLINVILLVESLQSPFSINEEFPACTPNKRVSSQFWCTNLRVLQCFMSQLTYITHLPTLLDTYFSLCSEGANWHIVNIYSVTKM